MLRFFCHIHGEGMDAIAEYIIVQHHSWSDTIPGEMRIPHPRASNGPRGWNAGLQSIHGG